MASLIQEYKLISSLSNAQKNLQNLFLIRDPLRFYTIITDSFQILHQMSQFVSWSTNKNLELKSSH